MFFLDFIDFLTLKPCMAGLVDGAEVPEDDAALLVSILSGAFSAEPEAEEAARASVQQRASRRDAYVI